MRNRTLRRLAPASVLGLLLVTVPAGSATAQARQTQDVAGWEIPRMPPPTPITPEEYRARRTALTDSLGDGVYVIFGAQPPAQDYLPYQQQPAFRYLTGIVEPGASLILVRTGPVLEERLFVQPKDPSREVWEGARLGPEAATQMTGVPAQESDRAIAVLDSLFQRHNRLFAVDPPPRDVSLDTELSWAQQVLSRVVARHPNVNVQSMSRTLQSIRAKKSAAELDRIRRATYISAEAHREAIRATAPDMNEFEIAALVEYVFTRHGGDGPAYASIVGSGPNSTTLHYNESSRCMSSGEVLLFDVGAYYDGYASDVTRTVPVNGRFTPEQRNIYETVLAAQKAAEAQLRQGARWADLNRAATAELAAGLAKHGLIDAPDATYDCRGGAGGKCPQLRLFYMHGLGHGVGLEVHDPDISQSVSFQPGSAVTIEPGLYIRSDVFDFLPDTPGNRAMIQRLRPVVERYANIGVRIEDVYIFDENGIERASRGAPREIDEVEALMKESAAAAAGRRADIVAWQCPRPRA